MTAHTTPHAITVLTDSGDDTTLRGFDAKPLCISALALGRATPDAIGFACDDAVAEVMALHLIEQHGVSWRHDAGPFLDLDGADYSDAMIDCLTELANASAAMNAERIEAEAWSVPDEDHFAQEQWGLR